MKNVVVFIAFTVLLSCYTKISSQTDFKNKDILLSEIYTKFSDNRHDYAATADEARDTILNRFKKTLLTTLSNHESATIPFDSLAKTIHVTTSKDKKLRIFSWNELNGGNWHIYNSAYQYNENNKSFSGFLRLENDSAQNPLFTDIIHFEIEDIEPNKYLVKGYGTHGSRQDFYVYRLLSFSDGKILDCNKCFDGKDKLVFEKSRANKTKPIFDTKTKQISYPEMVPSLKDGEDTGFTEQSGKIIMLNYENGTFVNLNN